MAERRITIGGHPLHPATVHFPIGLLGTVVIWDGLGLLRAEPFWWVIAHWVLVAGLVMAGIALASGFLDYLALPEDRRVMDVANRHMIVMVLAACVFLGRLLLHGTNGPPPASGRLPIILLSAVGALLLLAGGWLGGSLVYGHGVGRSDAEDLATKPER